MRVGRVVFRCGLRATVRICVTAAVSAEARVDSANAEIFRLASPALAQQANIGLAGSQARGSLPRSR
jgi:hypothetical protein